MFNRNSTNADIRKHDWAQRDRATLLHSIHAGASPRAPAVASSGWGADVTGDDPRSVRAYLAGKGDLRAAWWNFYQASYRAVRLDSTLEHAMYSFHRLHHGLTLTRLEFRQSVVLLADDIREKGIFAAVHISLSRELKR